MLTLFPVDIVMIKLYEYFNLFFFVQRIFYFLFKKLDSHWLGKTNSRVRWAPWPIYILFSYIQSCTTIQTCRAVELGQNLNVASFT